MFYEFYEPCYALIKAEVTPISEQQMPPRHKSVEVYEKHVHSLEGLTDYLKFRKAKAKTIYDNEAFYKFSRSLGENVSYHEAVKLFEDIPYNSIVLMEK